MSCETTAGSGRATTTSRMGLFKGKKREKTEAEQVAEDYNIIGKDKRIHPEEEEEDDEEESIPEPEPEPEPELSELDVASLKMKCASLGLKQSGAREELIHEDRGSDARVRGGTRRHRGRCGKSSTSDLRRQEGEEEAGAAVGTVGPSGRRRSSPKKRRNGWRGTRND